QAPECATVTVEHRNPETRDQRYGDVCVHSEPDQIVGDEAVEQSTKGMLGVQGKRRLQAEQRVCGDGFRGDHGRDERQPIGGTCNVAVGKARTSWNPNARVSAELITAPVDGSAEGIDLFALEHRTAPSVAIERREPVTVVGGIQFATERDVPAFVQRRNARADSLEHLKIKRAPDFGDCEVVVARQPGDEGAGQFDTIRSIRRDLLESFRTAEPEPASNCLRPYAVSRGDRPELHAALEGEDAVPVVEAGDRVDSGMIEEVAAERGTSTARHRASGKDEPDPSAPFCELQRTLDEQLIPIDV